MTEVFSGLASNWQLSRLDRVASVNARIGWRALTAAEYLPEGYAFLSTPNIKSRTIDFENVNYVSAFRYEESPELKLQVDDVLLAKDGSIGIVNLVKQLPRPATVNGSIAVLRAFDIHPGYLRYALASQPLQDKMNATKDGMGVPHLFQRDIKKLPIPVPSAKEQRRIAGFLDAHVSQLEAGRRLGRAQVLALEERRRVMLDLTHGDSSTPTTRRLGYSVALTTSGSRGWGDYASDEGSLFFRSANLRRDSIAPNVTNLTYVTLPTSTSSEARRASISPGDVLVGITGANTGWATLADQTVAGGYVSQHVCLIRPMNHELDGRWLAFLLASPRTQSSLLAGQYGGTKTQLSLPDIRGVRIPAINLENQRKIANDIADRIRVIERQKSLRRRQLELLAERRAALITAAVTGQFDVSTASGRGVEV